MNWVLLAYVAGALAMCGRALFDDDWRLQKRAVVVGALCWPLFTVLMCGAFLGALLTRIPLPRAGEYRHKVRMVGRLRTIESDHWWTLGFKRWNIVFLRYRKLGASDDQGTADAQEAE